MCSQGLQTFKRTLGSGIVCPKKWADVPAGQHVVERNVSARSPGISANLCQCECTTRLRTRHLEETSAPAVPLRSLTWRGAAAPAVLPPRRHRLCTSPYSLIGIPVVYRLCIYTLNIGHSCDNFRSSTLIFSLYRFAATVPLLSGSLAFFHYSCCV